MRQSLASLFGKDLKLHHNHNFKGKLLLILRFANLLTVEVGAIVTFVDDSADFDVKNLTHF